MKNLFSVCILVAFSVFPGCQKKKPPQAQAVAVETKKIEFVPPADSSMTIEQIKKMNPCNVLLDSLSTFYQDSFKTRNAALLTRFQEDFSRAQDKLCLRSGLAGGYVEYLWVLKNLGNPRNAKLLDSLHLKVY
jgi:hypothetical protein